MANPIKPQLQESDIRHLLHDLFSVDVVNFAPIGEGQTATAYAFSQGGQDYVIRFTAHDLEFRFQQEQTIAQRFASPALPIPKVMHIGEFGGYAFGVAEKAAGQALQHYERTTWERALPNLLRVHDAIRTADISCARGFGWGKPDGAGMFTSWHEHLRFVYEEEPEGMFYHKWHWMFDETFLERDVFDAGFKRMAALLSICPEERFLVHGGFGLSNVLGLVDGTITAVVDWTDVRYGDFVFDVAYADCWWDIGIAEAFAAHFAALGLDVPHFQERVRCYQIYTFLDAMRFFAKIDNADSYRHVRQRLLGII